MESAAGILLAKRASDQGSALLVLKDEAECPGQVAVITEIAKLLTSKIARSDNIIVVGSKCLAQTLQGSLDHQCNVHHIASLSPSRGIQNLEGELLRLFDDILQSSTGFARSCVILESLSDLCLLCPLTQVAGFVERLKGSTIVGLLGCLHTDVLPSGVLTAMQRSAKASLTISQPFEGLQTLGFPTSTHVDGKITLQEKKSTGRVAVKEAWFQLQHGTGIATVTEIKDPELKQPPAAAQPEQAYKSQNVGMRHTLNAQEVAARGSVALPYSKAADSGIADSSQKGQVSSGLGQIHYVRDSESEYDSDEDPDNDLDI